MVAILKNVPASSLLKTIMIMSQPQTVHKV